MDSNEQLRDFDNIILGELYRQIKSGRISPQQATDMLESARESTKRNSTGPIIQTFQAGVVLNSGAILFVRKGKRWQTRLSKLKRQ